MEVDVRLFATLRQERFRNKKIDLPEGTTAGEIIRQLNIPPKDVALIMINGKHAKTESTLRANDVVALFPFMAGG